MTPADYFTRKSEAPRRRIELPKAFLRVMHFALAALLVAACGNPQKDKTNSNSPPANSGPGPVERPAFSLRPAAKVGDKFRTSRVLRVEESAGAGSYLTESEEVTLTEVLRVDDSGRLMAVRRTWEASVTRFTREFEKPEVARGALDGCTLELTQKAGRVEARVVAGDVSVRGANFLIEGFDSGLLPLDPVRDNDFWVLEGAQLAGLSSIIEAMEFKTEKNSLTCQVISISPGAAELSLEWRISGEFNGAAAVLEFRGGLTFDRQSGLITEFSLKGGRQADRRDGRQIEITITRRPVKGWLDLER
jgi:hypothetical protein